MPHWSLSSILISLKTQDGSILQSWLYLLAVITDWIFPFGKLSKFPSLPAAAQCNCNCADCFTGMTGVLRYVVWWWIVCQESLTVNATIYEQTEWSLWSWYYCFSILKTKSKVGWLLNKWTDIPSPPLSTLRVTLIYMTWKGCIYKIFLIWKSRTIIRPVI